MRPRRRVLRNKGGQLLRDRKPTQITRKAKREAVRLRTHLQQVDFSYKRAAVGGSKKSKDH